MKSESIAIPLVAVLIALAVLFFSVRRLRALGGKPYGKVRRVSERVVLVLLAIAAIAVGVSTTFNAVAAHHYWAGRSVPGHIYRVNGYKMHLYCTGTGSPTVILDAGEGNDWTIWGKVQPQLSKTTRVCSYDRAGFGWSETDSGPHDADHIADQMHGLLAQAGIEGPIVLMGHSISGIYMRAYTSRYPKNIVGLVFVDGSTPLQQDQGPADLRAYENKSEATLLFAAKVLVPLGLLRDMGQCSEMQPGFDPAAGKMLAEDTCQPRIAAIDGEMANFRRSGEETIHTGPYGDLPVLIFSHDPSLPGPRTFPEKLWKEESVMWNQMQENLKNLSTRSRRIIAKGSSHYVQIDRPELLNREVPVFIQQIRGAAPQSTDYGSTKIE